MKELRFVARFCKFVVSFPLLALFVLFSEVGAQDAPAYSPLEKGVHASAAPKPAESWSSPILDRSVLPMLTPMLGELDDIPGSGFIRQRYQANWRSLEPFDLYVIRPRGVAKAPVIIYLYSFPDDTENFKNNAWCETAVSGGYAAVGLVAAASGHRIEHRLLKDWFIPSMDEALASTAHDIQLIIDYLATRNDVDTSRIGMFGLGSGGAIAILASAADPRIRAIHLVGPWADWQDWVATTSLLPEEKRAPYLKPDYLEKIAPLDPVLWLPKVKAKSVLLQDVRKNTSMPDSAQEKLESTAPDFAQIDQFGNGRAFIRIQPPALLFSWLKEQLKPDAKPQVAEEKSARVHFYPAIQPLPQDWPNVGNATKPESAKPQQVEKNNQ